MERALWRRHPALLVLVAGALVAGAIGLPTLNVLSSSGTTSALGPADVASRPALGMGLAAASRQELHWQPVAGTTHYDLVVTRADGRAWTLRMRRTSTSASDLTRAGIRLGTGTFRWAVYPAGRSPHRPPAAALAHGSFQVPA